MTYLHGNVKVNWLFLVATPRGDAMPPGRSGCFRRAATQFILPELTPLEWESDALESEVDEALTRCLASHVLLG